MSNSYIELTLESNKKVCVKITEKEIGKYMYANNEEKDYEDVIDKLKCEYEEELENDDINSYEVITEQEAIRKYGENMW